VTLVATVLATLAVGVDTTSYCLNGTMADGTWTRPGSAAHNGLPLGTRITIHPPFLGRSRWVVRDRIGWGTTLDLWAPSCGVSRQFGRRRVSLRVGWPRPLLIRQRRIRVTLPKPIPGRWWPT
jgi:3D (Asp-Asp-Asp) domain-containing protein